MKTKFYTTTYQQLKTENQVLYHYLPATENWKQSFIPLLTSNWKLKTKFYTTTYQQLKTENQVLFHYLPATENLYHYNSV
jgi:hypothetical protein